MTESSPEHVMFNVLKSIAVDGRGPRVGRLALPKRKKIDTPNFFGLTSRGAIPHMTPDVIAKYTELNGTYMALEDFVEKSQKRLVPAIYNIPQSDGKDALHAYTATPTPVATVLGARRHPAVIAPMGNGKDYISIYTSTGFQQLKNKDYYRAVGRLQPDIVVPLADLTFGNSHIREKLPHPKRQIRMTERTEDWLAEFIKLKNAEGEGETMKSGVFASLLPVSYPMQWEYITRLSQDYVEHLSGLAVYDADIVPDLIAHESLNPLPRLSMDFITSPHEILRQIRLGLDIFTVPFINTVSDAGIALTFSFPPPAPLTAGSYPLGIDMWSQDHQISLKPLADGCECYTCTKHHRAYLQHLLNAKEMLGWTLLQIHNHYVLDAFFKGIRATLDAEPSTFERDCEDFYRSYEYELPKGTGERPRARGYHFKTEGGQSKINPPAWENWGQNGAEDPALAGEMAGLAVTGATAEGKETPVVPDPNSNAKDLDEKGFAEIDR
ncbi:tRNA-guanine transglycosylase [Annulohypoxylon truncatum]|uniref:tRNA-guanine transglycosylase n=1 Tax=Annulohypoxylon truncatum TaxID=327061 RepID=UPI0020085811|nr:tRNA-guanine transglycosylase [Annulohypoxylon truncatum]KAI1214702.1 tRNA-guanine transglycosylase [Annulohypoxylon truncatum]